MISQSQYISKRDAGGMGGTRATGDGNEFAEGVDDDGPAPGEQTGVIVIGVDRYFHRIAVA